MGKSVTLVYIMGVMVIVVGIGHNNWVQILYEAEFYIILILLGKVCIQLFFL